MQFNKSLPCVVRYLLQALSATSDLIKDASAKLDY